MVSSSAFVAVALASPTPNPSSTRSDSVLSIVQIAEIGESYLLRSPVTRAVPKASCKMLAVHSISGNYSKMKMNQGPITANE